jgi:integrase/recombinase XerC
VLIEGYLSWMKALGKSREALRGSGLRLRAASRALASVGLSLHAARREDLEHYQGSLVERGLSPRSIECIGCALRAFFVYLEDSGSRLGNPASSLPRMRLEKRLPWDLPDEAAMERFLARLALWHEEKDLKARKWGFRALVMAELQYASALRIEELASLKADDIELERGLARVIRGKGGKPRRVFLSSFAVELLRLWLKARPLILERKHDARLLFGTASGTLGHAYNAYLDGKAREAGLSGFSSHRFRHALGYHLLRAGCDVRRIQDILGHRRISSTEIYTKVDGRDLRACLDAFHPRAGTGEAAP